ncbi:helix-turn-helix domain-containing protein [Azospirillum halopraeferens]|uniref:helix-turn-helix domain-containing protein n=1 Tax=Azospirillum halopraeferens TaxID=34010 RepID=UPI00054E9A72
MSENLIVQPYYTRSEAASLLRVSMRTLDRWRHAGMLHCVRSRTGRVRIPRDSLLAALAALTRGDL